MIKDLSVNDSFFNQLRPEQLLVTLFEAIPDVYYFVKDRESRFMAASQGFAQMLGEKSVSALLGKTDFDYSIDFLAAAFVEDDRRVMATGQPLINQVELVPAGETLDWLSTTKSPLYNMEGEIIGLAGVCHVIHDSDDLYGTHPEMRRIIEFIQARFREKIVIGDMARAAGISVSSVERLFRGIFGVTPLMYLRKIRLNAACRLLRRGDEDLATIAADCGFTSQTGMTRAFRQELKITPLKYRRRFSHTKRTVK